MPLQQLGKIIRINHPSTVQRTSRKNTPRQRLWFPIRAWYTRCSWKSSRLCDRTASKLLVADTRRHRRRRSTTAVLAHSLVSYRRGFESSTTLVRVSLKRVRTSSDRISNSGRRPRAISSIGDDRPCAGLHTRPAACFTMVIRVEERPTLY